MATSSDKPMQRAVQTASERAADMQAAENTIGWLNDHWKGGRHCPICQNRDWDVAAPLDLPIRQSSSMSLAEALIDRTRVYPVIPVMCKTCGYVHFFNAIHIGAVQRRGAQT